MITRGLAALAQSRCNVIYFSRSCSKITKLCKKRAYYLIGVIVVHYLHSTVELLALIQQNVGLIFFNLIKNKRRFTRQGFVGVSFKLYETKLLNIIPCGG